VSQSRAVIALAAGKWVKPLLFDQSPSDPAIFAIVMLGLLAVAVAASWLPARRASRVDASVALRIGLAANSSGSRPTGVASRGCVFETVGNRGHRGRDAADCTFRKTLNIP